MTNLCDSCADVAYDNGLETPEIQYLMMSEMGADVEDHFCDAIDEPDLWPDGCPCACYRHRLSLGDTLRKAVPGGPA